MNKLAASEREARPEIDRIPPAAPAKYGNVASASQWQNPFLIVTPDGVDASIMLPNPADARPSALSMESTFGRPLAARQREVTVRVDDLPELLASLPADAWTYGRVVAVQEVQTNTPRDRQSTRQNLDTTMKALHDLGFSVQEWKGAIGDSAPAAPQGRKP